MELSLVLVYLVPSHQVQVSSFYRWAQRTAAMSYPRSTQQQQNNRGSDCKHHISAAFQQPYQMVEEPKIMVNVSCMISISANMTVEIT